MNHNPIDKDRVWMSVNEYLNYIGPDVKRARDSVIYKMGGTTLHRGTAAQHRGWRYFFRLSVMKSVPRNEIRKQVNVYTEISNGW